MECGQGMRESPSRQDNGEDIQVEMPGKQDIDDEIGLEWHNNKATFKCKKCNKLFAYKHNVRSHIQVIHYKLCKYSCTICHKSF